MSGGGWVGVKYEEGWIIENLIGCFKEISQLSWMKRGRTKKEEEICIRGRVGTYQTDVTSY